MELMRIVYNFSFYIYFKSKRYGDMYIERKKNIYKKSTKELMIGIDK